LISDLNETENRKNRTAMPKDNKLIISNDLYKSLTKGEKDYLSFLSGLPTPVILCNKDNKVLFINDQFLEICSFTASDLLNLPVFNIFYTASEQEIGYFLKSLKIKTAEQKIIGKRGKPLEVLITHRNVIFTGVSQLKELYFTVLPIQGIGPVNKKYEALQTLLSAGYWELSHDRSRFSPSEGFLSLTGSSTVSGNIRFIDFLNLLPRKEDRENIERGLIGLTGTPGRFETLIKLKKKTNGKRENLFLIFTATWSDENKEPLFKGSVQDVTRMKKIEKELIKAKLTAERTDKIKSSFLTNLSYEIRTPMNAILGFSELLNLEDLSPEQKIEYSRIIRLKGNSLMSLIDDAVELSQFETGHIAINKTEFMLYPLLKELHKEYDERRIQMGKSNIILDLSIPEGSESETIYTDPGRLQQLLSYLLSNALKFTEKGSIEFGYKRSGKSVKFFVKDTGVGIEEADQNIIFNRFRDIEETSSKKLTGGGLSLTISRHIVELLGGKIKVKSELNRGSRFQIVIPIDTPGKGKQDMTEFEDIKTINWKDRVLLIAEDEDLNYRFLEAVFQKTQSKILRAKTGREAVELCKTISKIDLVLMDIKMPVMNGFEATRAIKKIRPTLPVIAQTAFASQEEILKCQKSGCDEVVTKPIDIMSLFRKINELMH
jgi:signal transduction histidine kinase